MVRFTHPQLFYLFIPFALFLVWNMIRTRKLQGNLNNLASESIRFFLLNRVLRNRVSMKSGLIIVGTAFLLLASTGPQIGTKLTELKREGVDVVLAIDVSKSMDAMDVKPSRLEKAKSELSRLINGLQGDRVGLILFSGTAHLHCPLTADYAAARLFLNMIDTNVIATQGTDLSSALELAMENVDNEEKKYKLIVLVTDGEDHEGRAIELAERAKREDIIIHTVGVGTAAGGPIPVTDESGNQTFKKDRSGNVITTALNDAVLTDIARITGGKYVRVENQANAIGPLIDTIENMEKREIKSQIFSQYEDRFQIFLILGLLCFLIEFFIPTRSRKEITWEGRFSQ